MRPRHDTDDSPRLTRRGLGLGLAAGVAAGLAGPAAARAAPMDRALRDAALRGLALADHRGDPVAAQAGQAALARLAETDPEGALLYRLYRKLDVRPSSFYRSGLPEAAQADLAVLHAAIESCQPVWFGYTDLSDQTSERLVLPLALVHPPQGVKLLAWCEKAADFRQFFVRAMHGLAPQAGDFSEDRLALLEGLAEKEGA